MIRRHFKFHSSFYTNFRFFFGFCLLTTFVIIFLYFNNQKPNSSFQDTNYQDYVDKQIATLKQTLSTPTPASSSGAPTPAFISSPKSTLSSKPLVSYVPIPGSGQTLNNQWTNLPGTEFYLDKSDFPGLKNVFFEANFRLFNGNGKAYLRLFDITNGIEIWGSQIETDSQQNTMISSTPLTLRQFFGEINLSLFLY